eukprot:CAMPEP_0119501966 /NCGR_PEP_ID=MMETSP1344-20130328/23604_1 /TAXON_ID=236787 /ORGANISM="Florenciella parvula, Strain CCMP2471" /LENGTH=252 /DNA_ID=CAMNT_0007538151 /DNA_START=11 /DNA_END=769 /DNA_ORIENTATION=+
MAEEPRAKRTRVAVERLGDDAEVAEVEESGPEGSGEPLGEIDYVNEMIGKIKDDDVARLLHTICYGKPGKQTTRKKGLRAFNGWADASVAKTKADKLATNNKVKVTMIKEVCGVLGLEKSGTKDELCSRVTEFLAKPSGENVVKSAPKKRKAAKGKKKKGKKGKKGPKKPRAPSAYILFCKVARPKVVEEEPDLGSTEIMTKMGAMWKALSDDEQGKYKKQSAALKAEMEGGAAEASEEEAEESEEEGSDEE